MKHVVFGLSSLACAATIVGGFAVAHAQTTVPTAPTLTVPDLKAGQKSVAPDTIEVPFEERQVNVLIKGQDLASLFPMLAKNTNVQIIVADDVKGASVAVSGKNLTAETALDLICNANNLAWGKVGQTTYLVVKQNPKFARLDLDLRSYQLVPKPTLPNNEQPYNGQPPQANQRNFKLWLLDRKQAQTEK